MKKSLLVSLSSIVFLLIASGIGFPSVSNAQIASNIKCAEGWWADCCKCGNCLSVDPPPAYGYCRHCHLLCPKCRKELGNLDQALEKIRSQNRGLQEAYKAFQSDYGRAQDLLNQAMEKIFGKESDWINMSNVNSS